MDTGLGEFAQVSPNVAALIKGTTAESRIFQLDEIVRIKDSAFRIESIGTQTMKLRLIPDDNYQQIRQHS